MMFKTKENALGPVKRKTPKSNLALKRARRAIALARRRRLGVVTKKKYSSPVKVAPLNLFMMPTVVKTPRTPPSKLQPKKMSITDRIKSYFKKSNSANRAAWSSEKRRMSQRVSINIKPKKLNYDDLASGNIISRLHSN